MVVGSITTALKGNLLPTVMFDNVFFQGNKSHLCLCIISPIKYIIAAPPCHWGTIISIIPHVI